MGLYSNMEVNFNVFLQHSFRRRGWSQFTQFWRSWEVGQCWKVMPGIHQLLPGKIPCTGSGSMATLWITLLTFLSQRMWKTPRSGSLMWVKVALKSYRMMFWLRVYMNNSRVLVFMLTYTQLDQPALGLSREYLMKGPQEPEVQAYAKYQVCSSFHIPCVCYSCECIQFGLHLSFVILLTGTCVKHV